MILKRILTNKPLLLAALLAVLIIFVSMKLRGCRPQETFKQHQSLTLGENLNEKIIFNPATKTLTRISRLAPDGNGPVPTSPAEVVQQEKGIREAVVEIDKAGKGHIVGRYKGFHIEPGLTAAVSASGPRLGLDVSLAFYRYWDFSVGVNGNLRPQVDPRVYASVSYNVYSNTSIFFALDNKKDLQVGVRIKL